MSCVGNHHIGSYVRHLAHPIVREYDFIMMSLSTGGMHRRSSAIGTMCVVLLLSGCILAQMLGAPITLSSLLASPDLLSESVYEGFSLPSMIPEPEISGPRFLHAEFQSAQYLSIFLTSVFHPPQTQHLLQ